MKRFIAVFAVLTLALGNFLFGFGELTGKVDKLIESNQSDLERTYAPRDLRPSQFSIKLGPPLALGVEYSYNMNSMFALKAGAGSTIPGFAADMGVIVYLLPTTIAPYVSAGIDYYGNFTQNLLGVNVGVGVDVALENGFGISLGIDWVRSLSNAGAPFQNMVYNGDVINWFNATGGLNFRFK